MKQRLASILNIANLENGYHLNKSKVIEELKQAIGLKDKQEKTSMPEFEEKQHINNFAFAKGDNK